MANYRKDSDEGSHRWKDNENESRGDKYTWTDKDSGKHTHESYTYNKDSGCYKEYHGGENSSDRGYNKSDDGGSGK